MIVLARQVVSILYEWTAKAKDEKKKLIGKKAKSKQKYPQFIITEII